MNRRDFLKVTGAAASGAVGAAAMLAGEAQAAAINPESPLVRRGEALALRAGAAQQAAGLALPPHPSNGEEEAYPHYIASFSKGLPHDNRGEVDPAAYRALLDALASKAPASFEQIPLGGTLRFTSPQSAYAFDLIGPDSHGMAVRPAPRIDSPEGAGELAELYWMAVARDIPFGHFDTDPTIAAACRELSTLTDFRGPKRSGRVTPETVFRGTQPGCLVGPLISQFLWLPIPMGAQPVEQRIQTTRPGLDYLTRFNYWLAMQRGATAGADSFDATPRYIRSMRDIGQWVHVDALYQA
jgi:hypothetical protein